MLWRASVYEDLHIFRYSIGMVLDITVVLFTISPLAALVDDPDRSCTVACQDSLLDYRFYRVNGREGWFPFGTDCSRNRGDHHSYCLNGKCLVSGLWCCNYQFLYIQCILKFEISYIMSVTFILKHNTVNSPSFKIYLGLHFDAGLLRWGHTTPQYHIHWVWKQPCPLPRPGAHWARYPPGASARFPLKTRFLLLAFLEGS